MKLYTEEQVKDLANMVDGYSTDELIASLTPIEIPNDEEIGQEFKYSSESWQIRQALEEGAKWMREQILKQQL